MLEEALVDEVVAFDARHRDGTYLPVLQTIFATEAVPFLDGVLMVGIGIALFTIIEIEKQIRLRLAPAAGF